MPALISPNILEDAAVALAMELWLKLGCPAEQPLPTSADSKAFAGLHLLHRYDEGEGERTHLAIEWIKEAADAGCAIACEYLGWEELVGSLEKNKGTYALKAAKAGRAEPYVKASGFDKMTPWTRTRKPPASALAFTFDAFSETDPEAAWYLAVAMKDEYPEWALSWAKRALADGSRRADYEIALLLMTPASYWEALPHLRDGAAKGDSRCATRLIEEIDASAQAYLEYGMHRARYLKEAASQGHTHGIEAYAHSLWERGKPGDEEEACQAMLVLQQSYRPNETIPVQAWKARALPAYPGRGGKVPLRPAWDWLWDRVGTAPMRDCLLDYSGLWSKYVFNPKLDKAWLTLEPVQ